MIVFSDAMTLTETPGATEHPNAPAIGYRTVATAAAIVADTEEDAYPASNLANVSTAALWRAADDTAQYLTITPAAATEMDYIGIARHNFGSAQIAVTVEGKAEAGDAWSTLVQETMVTDDSALLLRWAPQTLYAVRVGLASGLEPAEAAVLYAGKLLVMQRRLYVGHTPITMGRNTSIVTGRSETGNFLGRIITGSSLRSAASFANINPAWYRANFDPFAKASRAVPFFWAWRPLSYPLEVGFAWLNGDPTPVNARNNGMMSVEIDMTGIP